MPERLWIAALCLVLEVLPDTVKAAEIRVAVASNFKPAFTAIAQEFEAQGGHRVITVSGSTGKHYAQIINGAPFDVFLAADVERPARLEAEGSAIPGSRFTYALGRLALWSRHSDLVDASGDVLRSDRFQQLAIANPELAPYGRAARDTLYALGLWESIQPRLVRGENVAQALVYAHSGNADLAFVAWSQLRGLPDGQTGSHWRVPASLHAPLEQQAVLLRDGTAARMFMVFLRGPDARRLIRDFGYDTPP